MNTRQPNIFNQPARRAARGFTLLELLVALAMAGIIAVALYSTLRIAFKAQSSAHAAVEPVRTAELALSLLRADLEGALPAKSVSLDGRQGSQTDASVVPSTLAGPFLGTPAGGGGSGAGDELEFYTTGNPMASVGTGAVGAGAMGMGGGIAAQQQALGAVGAGEVRRVIITAVPDPAGSRDRPALMVVRRVTENLLAPVEQPPADEILCRGVSGFRLRYFDGFQWVDSWDSTQYEDQIPPAVEVTIELERPRGSTGERQLLRFPRVFLLSCSTLSADSAASASTLGGSSSTSGSTSGR